MPASSWILHFIAGPRRGDVVAIEASTVRVRVGRVHAAPVHLKDATVSRHHADVWLDTDEVALVVQDLGSTNGTFLNGEKIKRALVHAGDHIQVGHSVLRAEYADGRPFPPLRVPTVLEVGGDLNTAVDDDEPTAMVMVRVVARPPPSPPPAVRVGNVLDDVEIVPPKR